MEQITCPKCGATITVSENDYQALLEHIRTKEFEKLVNDKKEQLTKENDLKLQLKIKEEKEKDNNELKVLSETLNNKNIEIEKLKGEFLSAKKDIEAKVKEEIDKKNQEISRLNNEIALTKEKTLSLNKDEINNKNLEIEKLKNNIDLIMKDNEVKVREELNKKNQEIENLKKEIDLTKERTLSLNKDEIYNKEKEINNLKNQIELSKQEVINEYNLKLMKKDEEIKNINNLINEKDEMIDHLKDLKVKLSTKGIGEDLEVYCKNKFDSDIRPFLMQSGNDIYFEKDNTVIDGQKGDFVYKETTKAGAEILTIMFEMKNEMDTTATKHKNEDFFSKLDKDRKNKKCEYAVLVSLLEIDNEQYNNGITTVYGYDNMYVIRPNSLGALINLLRNNAIKNTEIKNELVNIRNQNIDVSNFETELNTFKDSFSKNVELAHNKFESAIENIDKTIERLQKVREELVGSGKNLNIANNKLQEITIKKLTKNSPTVKEMFDNNKKEA